MSMTVWHGGRVGAKLLLSGGVQSFPTVGAVIAVNVTGLTATASVGTTTVVGIANVSVTGVSATASTGNELVWGEIDSSQTPAWSVISGSQTPGWIDIAA